MATAFGWLAAGLSAALLWSAFPPCGETVNLAAALAPLLAVSRLAAPKRAVRLWLAGGFAFWFATLSWMPAIVKNNGPWPLVVLGWIGLAALCAAYFALFGWLSAKMWRLAEDAPSRRAAWRLAAIVIGEPVLWMGCEWLRGNLFSGFAWNFLGTALGCQAELAATARWGGVYLVSAMVVLLNGVVATLICRVAAQMRGDARRAAPGRFARMLETALPLAIILAATLNAARLGWRDMRRAEDRGAKMRVALVQRNEPCVFKADAEREPPFAAYARLAPAAAVARPDLCVWGESAMCSFGRVDGPRARAAARRFLEETGGCLVAGGDAVDAPGPVRKVRNAAALYLPDDSGAVRVETYAKQHLVPFGEYIPLDKIFTPLQKLSPIGVSLWPGEARTFTIPLRDGRGECKIAPLICFEDTVPALARRAARLGAQAIVLITNDSWFSNSCEAEQHAWQAVLRAIETGLPVIRTGNSGVTGVVDLRGLDKWLCGADGQVLTDAPGVMSDIVNLPPPDRAPTVYVRFGDWPMLGAFALVLAVIAAAELRRRAAERGA